MINVQLVNSIGNLKADVIKGEYDQNSLIVATEPLISSTPVRKTFSSNIYGDAMNVQVGYGNTPELVFNGDDIQWTLSNISGVKAFNNTVRPYAGSYSLQWNDPNQGDVFQLAKGSDIDLSNYVAITFWLNIDNGLGDGDNIEIYGHRSTSEVGNRIDLDNYCNSYLNDTWQFVTIPLQDMGLVNKTIDSIRFQLVAQNKKPNIFIDTMQIEEKSTELAIFKIEPNMQTHLYIYQIRLFISDTYDSTLLNGTIPRICATEFLGVPSLASGISFGVYHRDNPNGINIIKDIKGFLQLGNTYISNSGTNGTNTYITLDINFPVPVELKWENQDSFQIRINDDLSGLQVFTASAMCSWHYSSLERNGE